MRVDLGGGEIGVPEELLHRPEIGSPFEKMRRIRVTKHVRVETPSVRQWVGRDDPARVARRQLTPAAVEKHHVGRGLARHEGTPAMVQIVNQRVPGRIGRGVWLFARGGLAALAALDRADWDIFGGRPRPSRARLALEVLRT